MKFWCSIFLVMLLALASFETGAGAPAAEEQDIARLKEKYASADEIRVTPIAGLYELRFGYRLAYVDASGRFGFLGSGDLEDMSTGENLSGQRRAAARRKLMASLDEWDTLDFLPDDTVHQLLVFTDVDCGYCRRMHQQMAEYHRLGIGVRYAAYPRSGPDTGAWAIMRSIWCSDNRHEAMTLAKTGNFVTERQCDSMSVERHYELGRQIGLAGTPALLTPDGQLIPGYVPPGRLAAILGEEKSTE